VSLFDVDISTQQIQINSLGGMPKTS